MRSVSHQDVFAIVAMLLFALGMGVLWIALRGFGDDFGMGFAVGGIFVGALVFVATGWRSGAPR
ncbi:hypothetical protein FHU13_004485 [Methylobacterium sp. R2-1]|nr:hypothetical protein [Methylobacterium sp. R2-1]